MYVHTCTVVANVYISNYCTCMHIHMCPIRPLMTMTMTILYLMTMVKIKKDDVIRKLDIHFNPLWVKLIFNYFLCDNNVKVQVIKQDYIILS